MKLVGTILIWAGALMLLKNIGLIRVIDASVVWPVVIIILGSTLKRCCHHGMMCGMLGKCKMNKEGEGMVCDKCSK